MDLAFFGGSLFFLFLAALHYLLFLVYQNPVVPKVARYTLYLAFVCQILFSRPGCPRGGSLSGPTCMSPWSSSPGASCWPISW